MQHLVNYQLLNERKYQNNLQLFQKKILEMIRHPKNIIVLVLQIIK